VSYVEAMNIDTLQKIIDRLMPSPIAIPLKVLEIKELSTTTDAHTFRATAQVGRSQEYKSEYSVSEMAIRVVSFERQYEVIYQCFEFIGRALLNNAYLDLVGMHFPDVLDRYHREMHEGYERVLRAMPAEIQLGGSNGGLQTVTIGGIPIHESLPITMIIKGAMEKQKPSFDMEYLGCPAPITPADQIDQVRRFHDAGLISTLKATELVGKMFPVVKDIEACALLPGAKFRMAREARLRIAFWRKL
jgi:hypothetical protein